jgi:hypothetical protein
MRPSSRSHTAAEVPFAPLLRAVFSEPALLPVGLPLAPLQA